MFKLILSLTLLAACSANLYNDKVADYHINVGAGHIIVSNNYGYQVNFIIDRGQISVQVTGLGQVLDSEHIVNQPVPLAGKFEADILYQIFDNFSGILDEVTYEKLLHIVSRHVQDGHVHPIVWYALQMLANQQQTVELLDPSHQHFYDTVYGMFRQHGYDRSPFSGSLYGIGAPGYGGVGAWNSWYGLGRPAYGGAGAWGSWFRPGKTGYSGIGSWYPGAGAWNSWRGASTPGYAGVGAWGNWHGFGARSYGGLGSSGSWYGLGRQAYGYPGSYGKSWSSSFYGPYSSGVWSYPSYGLQYGYGHQMPYGGFWSQWQNRLPYQNQLWVN